VVKLPRNKDTGLERELGVGESIELTWPDYYEPSLDKVKAAVEAAGQAKTFGLVDDEHASRFVADYFGVEDVQAMLEKTQSASADLAHDMATQIAAMAGAPGLPQEQPEPEPEPEEPETEPLIGEALAPEDA
jgi:hypothetical protein